MRLNVKAFGLTCGIIWGASVFLATLWIMARGGTGEILSKLGRFYLGYTVSPGGAFVGLIWGFVDALIVGMIFAALYNAIAGGKKPSAESPDQG